MSDGTRPIAALGIRIRCPPDSEMPSLRPFRFCPPLRFGLWLRMKTKKRPKRPGDVTTGEVMTDDRRSRARKNCRTQEVQLVVARSCGHRSGGSGRGGLPRLLAPPDELADRSAGMFLSGLPELRRQAAV